MNNRSMTTLSKAGIPQSEWVTEDISATIPRTPPTKVNPDTMPGILQRLEMMGGQALDLDAHPCWGYMGLADHRHGEDTRYLRMTVSEIG